MQNHPNAFTEISMAQKIVADNDNTTVLRSLDVLTPSHRNTKLNQ